MIDLQNEQIFPLSRPPKFLVGRTGRPIHRTTFGRWFKDGVRGVKFETALMGGTRVSSVEAVERFMRRLSEHSQTAGECSQTTSKHLRTPLQRRKASDDAAAKLVKKGY